jgi:hypothetical protein
MANLRANKITSTEVFETTGSVQFDGTGDRLTLNNSNFVFGTLDFTVELFVYKPNTDQEIFFSQLSNSATGRDGIALGYQSGQFWILQGNGSSWDLETNVGSFPTSRWVHFAVSRDYSASKTYYFIDGQLVYTYTTNVNLTAANNGDIVIGNAGTTTDTYSFTGHISNLRVLKGQALYTENFTPPTRELEVIPNTVLLACQSTTNAAEEKTGKTITVNGNAVANELTPGLLTNVVKSGGSSAITGSVEFDGTGDYLSLAYNSDLWFGDQNWTLECWLHQNSFTNYGIIWDFGYGFADNTRSVVIYVDRTAGTPGRIRIAQSPDGGTNYDTDLGLTLNTNSWHHLAVVRNGSNVTGYLNGIAGNSVTAYNLYNATSRTHSIGIQGDLQAITAYNGFISNLRIIKGTALYTQDFIPPTRNLTKLPGTVLLCCQDSNDPTTEATGKTITGYGDLQKADGVELVTNGTFDTDTTGWSTGQSASLSVVSNRLRVTNGTSDYGIAETSITTVVGKVYRVTADFIPGTGTIGDLRASSTSLSNNLGTTGLNSTTSKSLTFTATTTTTYINVYGDNVNGNYTDWDNISVTLAETRNGASDFTPSVGSDDSVEFAGPTTINTENYFYLPTGPTEQRGRGRGIIFGGYTSPASVNNIQYVSIQSTGTAQDFGDLTAAASISGAVSSSTRAISAGGFQSPSPATYLQTIDYVTIATTGNAATFGQLQGNRGFLAGISNSTRGVFVSGYKQTPAPAATTGETDYITIASLGNTQDFGTATFGYYQDAGCSSSTRGLVAGVNNPGGGGHTTNIQYLTIATTGNTQSFGDLTVSRRGLSATSNSTRAVFCGGYTGPTSHFNVIDYVTISSTGSAQDFGDAVFAGSYRGATASSNRGIFINGYTPSLVNHIDYINISSTGNALDFGDSLITAYSPSGASDSHGGLG